MSRAFLFIIALISFLPLLYFPTPGHDALLLPFNIFLWEIAAASIFFAGLYIYKNRVGILPQNALFFLALPAGIILSGFITGIERPVDWLFRLAAILLGLCFFFSLFQFQANRRTLDNAIYIILAGLLANAVISFLQMMPGRPLFGVIPHPATPRAVGVFMQPNILASAMVTTVLLALYQISSPGFPKRALLIKAIAYAALFSATVIVFSTGSRIGLLGIVLSLPTLVAARYKLLARRRRQTLASLAIFVAGFGIGMTISEGALNAYSKLERLAETGTEARLHVYRISWNLYTEKPLFGHGIGSFQSAFHEHAADYMHARGDKPIIGDARFTHPHNEFLFWAIEGGSLALLGILVVIALALLQAWRLGRERGLALVSLLLPIALHTQTELPFYSSIFHWLLFLFLAYLLFAPMCKQTHIKLSEYAIAPFPAAAMAILLATLMFCTSTFSTARDLTRTLLYKEVNLQNLRDAQDNLYFNELATLLTLKVLLNEDLTQGTQHWTQAYINWTEEYLQHVPETSSYHDLALAYNHLGMKEKAIETINRGLYLYPQHPVISSALEKINSGVTAQTAIAPDETLITE